MKRGCWTALGAALVIAGCVAGPEVPRIDAEAAALGRADAAFVNGDLATAARGYERHLEKRPAGPRAAELLFRVALIELAPASGRADPARAIRRLQQISRSFPDSPYRVLAESLLAREAENRELRQRLEQLKQIDLERRKGPPPG